MKYIIVGALLAASPAHCMVYMWRDSTGVSHYTNKEYEIPDRYRLKVKVLYPEATDSRAMPLTTSSDQKVPDAQQSPVDNQQVKTAVPQKEQAPVAVTQQKDIVPAKSMRRVKRQRGSTPEE